VISTFIGVTLQMFSFESSVVFSRILLCLLLAFVMSGAYKDHFLFALLLLSLHSFRRLFSFWCYILSTCPHAMDDWCFSGLDFLSLSITPIFLFFLFTVICCENLRWPITALLLEFFVQRLCSFIHHREFSSQMEKKRKKL